ncbi:MAG TPA: PilZ domain-containing protein [Terracidiphilus sp.]|nr:PilZ domain-containing protein [Terracidiphilus sp.]
MRSTEQIDWSARAMEAEPTANYAPKEVVSTEARAHCAYNQTRECFLGLEVAAAEYSYTSLGERLAKHALKSGEGLWLMPFHGIPTTGLYAPLDLIYLDEDCRVTEAVESFPTFLANASSPRAASVLVLPAHSIYSSQTQVGDQLVLCVAEEMEWRLERLAERIAEPGPEQITVSIDDSSLVQGAALLREQPLWSGGPGLVELGGRSEDQRGDIPPAHEMSLIEPGIRAVRPPRNWLERWWSPDPRKAPREKPSGLAAYYWNGAASKAHTIRDISSSGLYLVTEERWYPGTLVLMTLQRTGGGEEIAERSISVMSRAVRWGNDGVGLQFVLPQEQNAPNGMDPQLDGASKREFEQFLQELLRGRG